MKTIDLGTWPRRRHYELFRTLHNPHFNIAAPIDVERLLHASAKLDATLTILITYLLARTANELVNFRWRIRGDEVIEHKLVHPSITILTADELFSFCTIKYAPGFEAFAAAAAARIVQVRETPTLVDEPDQDDLLYMTSIPWVSFTSFSHPMPQPPVDSVPRFAWGKIQTIGDRSTMPLSVQVHHALVDGLHVGRYFEKLQSFCDNPDSFLDG